MPRPTPLKRPSTLRRGAKPASEPARRPSERRLTRKDWILTGQDILREQGIAGLKLSSLTGRLGVSTGSFYHHFTDFENYLGSVAEYYSADRVQGLIDRATAGDPVTRMQQLAKLSLEDRTFELDHAMRIWATMDERAAVTMAKSERLVLAFLAQAFQDLGFPPAEASLRARILLSANIAPLLTADGRSRRNFFKRTLEILAGTDGDLAD
ncbi:MAG: TetR/AcrR family transcriptional regulator [Bradyrhizobium sp.]|uniref:TetR/AcrR family transcriptional regulator n=1 Tax=Bradyrhizobium sp. TaxID=376 RepID=UPI001E16FC42|nr:TetR/AcrR family transcriptional regulator [Bradyrhizobium sp.]MBV9561182.1 TetR/AcrR family transcriptional regulator [Bradyrhizobium sp.]